MSCTNYKGDFKKVKMVYLLCIWVLRCWNRSGCVVLQSRRRRVDLEESEPEQELNDLIWSISFFHLMFHQKDFFLWPKSFELWCYHGFLNGVILHCSPVCSHCTPTGRRARWRPEVKPAPTASPHTGGCSTGWTERKHAHIHTAVSFSQHVDIMSPSWVFHKINTHTLPSCPMLKTVFSS